jgi:fatty-acyl-CoA synthase
MEKYFSEVVEKHAKTKPDHIAYIFMGQETTYGKFNEDVNRVTNSFLSLGLRPGDKIATILPQSPAFLNIYMAAASMGLVLVPLDPRFKSTEMAELCVRTRPRLLVSLAYPENIKEAAQELIKKVDFDFLFSYFGMLDDPKCKPYEELLTGSPQPVPDHVHPDPDAPLVIIFTSGSTGIPKGAVISHKNTWSIVKASVEAWGINSNDSVLVNMPTSHVAGTHDLIAIQLYAGATGIICPKFDPQEVLEFISKYKITYFGGVPTMYRIIMKKGNMTDYDLSSIRIAVVSGEPSPPELIYKISSVFPQAKIVASWGMSETAGFFTFTKPDDPLEIAANTEGAPGIGLQMKIVKIDGTQAQPGEIGEMLVKGDSVISGYMDEESNKDAFVDGWLKTGDLGYLDENNYLHFAGRSKEMYISGGYNVYPLEIESYLNACPGINTSAVIEIPHDIFGETGVAFIVPEEGADLNLEKVKQYVTEGLADYKRPSKIIIEKDIPKTLIGKINKKELRKNIGKYL